MSAAFTGLTFIIAIVACIIAIKASRHAHRNARRLRTLENDFDDLVYQLEQTGMPLESKAESAQPIYDDEPNIKKPIIQAQRVEPQIPTEISGIDWEQFLGRHVVGWVAIALVLLAATFFLRYAFETVFGPTARILTVAGIGMGFCLVGARLFVRCYALGAWMVTAVGLLILYLAIDVSFAMYELIAPSTGAVFLAIVMAEGVLFSLVYRAKPLAYLALFGALVIPALIPTERDQHLGLFLYLGLVNLGAAILTRRWPHPGLSLMTYLGAQILFWIWFAGFYHPEKLIAVLAFQCFLYLLWLISERFEIYALAAAERVFRSLVLAIVFFVFLRRIVMEETPPWVGVLALSFSLFYTLLARVAFSRITRDTERVLTFLTLGISFVAVAIAIQGGAPWSAVGWSVMGTALWWFGLRLQAIYLKMYAVLFSLLSIFALTFVQYDVNEPIEVPLVNPRSMPTIVVAMSLLTTAWIARRFQSQLDDFDRVVRYSSWLVAVALGWGILTWETNNTCRVIFLLADFESQTAVSIAWALYAAFLLACGFIWNHPPTRWTGLGLIAITVLKLITYDLSALPAIYRAITFLMAALVLAFTAWGYTRVASKMTSQQEQTHD